MATYDDESKCEFLAPDCNTCGHVDGNGGCTLRGQCAHLYKPDFLIHMFAPIRAIRSGNNVVAFEYDTFVNCDPINRPENPSKLTLSSKQLHALYHEDSERTNQLAKVINDHK